MDYLLHLVLYKLFTPVLVITQRESERVIMSYYHGLISSKRAESILSRVINDGCFLLRDSQSQPGHFVLSVKYDGKVYHVLVFHEFGEYYLDSSGGSDERFSSLEDLVLFGMGHELRVAGDEVTLLEPVICDNGGTVAELLLKPQCNRSKRREGSEDCDALTDLFASVFHTHCSVLVVTHSSLKFDGTPLPSGESYLVCVVKDNKLKSFLICTIDVINREVIAEKKITKSFAYDMPSDLVLTFLSEHGITCVGFKNDQERDMFTRHIDRIVQMQAEKSGRGRECLLTSHNEAKPSSSPTEMKRPIKAEEFDINNLSPEWEYLFEQAGVTLNMLQDTSTLQFILDQIYELGGAPKKVQTPPHQHTMNDQRSIAITMDATLRHETIRADRLADRLKECSLSSDDSSNSTVDSTTSTSIPKPLPRKCTKPTCTYSAVCCRYKDALLKRNSLTNLSPNILHCYCSNCAAGKPLLGVAGSPPQQYTAPVGWCQFILKSQTHSLAQKYCTDWHIAYSCIPSSQVAEVIRTGHSIHTPHQVGGGGKINMGKRLENCISPDIAWAKLIAGLTSEYYYDETERADFRVNTAFQIFVQPGSYTVDSSNDYTKPLQQSWHVKEKAYITHALLVHLQQL